MATVAVRLTATCTYISVALLLFSVRFSSAKIVTGTLKTQTDWEFLARFCFLSDVGRLRFHFEYPVTYEVENILLYYDEPDQWEAVYKTDTNCIEKESVLKIENNQIINLTDKYPWSGCAKKNVDASDELYDLSEDGEIYDCKGGRSFKSVRERWWYVAVSNCYSDKPQIGMRFSCKLTNGESYWTEHFSADEFYILQTNIVFICLFGIILFLSIYVAMKLKSRQLFHTTYKMYLTAIVFYVLALFFLCIYYGDYGHNGIGVIGLKTTGRIFQSVSNLTFLLMLILLAKGFTVTRGRISHSGSVKIAIFMTLYVIVYAILFIYEAVAFDPGLVLYIYESPAGYGLIALSIIGWLWFIYAIFFTLKHYPEKGAFYYPFFIFYTFWFLALPIVVLVSTYLIDKWVREKVVNAIDHTIALLAFFFFLIITRPSAANKNFPYHVRTSQIGALHTPNGTLSEDVDGFSHHAYNSNVFIGHANANFTELFTVSGNMSNGTNDVKRNNNDNGTANHKVDHNIFTTSNSPSATSEA
ncbi:transmembrane protein 145-like isoform X2 [Ptychodera flava]|uniref:transmembrane protein 145-like isoform X2 n=1 Tax=Ptychodera flava TaxID=63121 RepID=UPI00396A76F0